MSKHYSKKRRLKYVLMALACTASFAATGLATACTPEESDNDETGKTTSKEDVQLLKNGNFEFFNVPDKKDGEPAPEYLINTPNNWTRGGTTSYTMSGIIGTSAKAWDKLTADDLAERLDANNALVSSQSDYKEKHIDFNGMKSSDLLYKDSYGALKYGTISEKKDGDKTTYYIGEGDNKTEIYYDEAKETYYYDAEHTKPISKETISNPGTHNIVKEEGKEPYYLDENGKTQKVYEDENGDYYLSYDEKKDEYSQPVGHVLMLHNYSNSTHNGIAQNYASIDVSLPANTSAEISVWVKTSDLLFAQGRDVNEDQDHGANITVTHTVGSTTLDDFAITSINTEKLIGNNKVEDKYNGWVQYTVYVNACNFASSNITLKLGLGETANPVEGYAFFDDVTVTKIANLDNYEPYKAVESKIKTDKAACTLTSDASEKIFVADTYERNGGADKGGLTDDRFSGSFHYLLDLTAESGYDTLNLASSKVGFTVDSDNYISSKNNSVKTVGFESLQPYGKVKLPDDLKNLKTNGVTGNGLDTSEDLLALVSADKTFTDSETKYFEKLNEAVRMTDDFSLPHAADDSKTIVLFSAKGTAYTSSFDLSVGAEGYKIVSFWVKTSEMNGSTAATVKITDKNNKDNTANVTVDSTNVVTDIDDDNKDIFHGWVQCFFFVHNELNEDAEFNIEFSFGNTTLNGTSITSYKAGWAALTNVQTLEVKEEVFAYTGSGNYTASITVSEDEKKTTSAFDEVLGNQAHKIESSIADPTTYFGTNGGSSKVVNNGVISPFDDKNPNDWAGLINKEYFVNKDNKYTGYTDADWYKTLIKSFNPSSTDALASWNEIFGSKSIQPLLIVNKLRQDYVQEKKPTKENCDKYFYYDSDKKEYVKATADTFDENTKYYTLQDVINYGFIGEEKTVSANGYTTISVRVKVSAGAIAYIYLVDTTENAEVIKFNTPSYSFWYDEDGNVLKAELDEDATLAQQRANVLYTLLDNGLYRDKDGKLRANIWNYTKLYNANITYYTYDGEELTVDDLVEGETYYKDKDHNEADHFLVTGEGVKIYECKDGKYYYIVNGETQKDEVLPFEKEYARYSYSDLSEQYVEIIGDSDDEVNEWITVNFVLHAGSNSKNYRLELWSGQRDKFTTDGNDEEGVVIFDYSYTSVTSDDWLNEYENEIIKAYQKVLSDKGLLNGIATSTENIRYYKNLADKAIADGKLKQADLDKYDILKEGNYRAHYYTYSLYDSADFQPFNREVADETATGYDYSVNSYEESLAYLYVNDENVRTVFTDYSTIDQSISLDLGSNDEDEDEDEDETDDNGTNVWLLASSILLVVAMVFAIVAIFVKDLLKKRRRKNALSKNSYNTNKANRYIRKLGIKKEEIEEVEATAETNDEAVEENEQPVEETVEEPTEETVETENVETEETVEENNESNEDGQE